jgi:hypothetical protein
MSRSEHLIQSIQSYAEAVVYVRRGGHVDLLRGELEDVEEVAATVSLITSSVEQLGVDADNGPLDTMMFQFRERVVMVARTPDGLAIVVARNNVQPGLLLSHIRQLQAVGVGGDDVAEAS